MAYEWNWWALPWTALLPASLALAFLVYRIRPDHFQNRVLALMLAAEGLVIGTSGGLIYFAADARTAIAWQHVGIFFAALMLVLYPMFLTTIPSSWVRWVPRRSMTFGAVVVVVFLWALWLSTPAWDVQGTHATYYASHEANGSPFLSFEQMSTVPMMVIGLALAGHAAFRRGQDPLLRRQAVIWMCAFGIRDVAYALFLGLPAMGVEPAWLGAPWVFGVVIASIWVYLGLLAYGVLTTQMFGADLKFKIGISRGTVAALIAAAAFVGSEVIEQVVGVDQLIPAIAIAGAATLAFKPLSAIGNRVADRVMPGVDATEGYGTRRRQAIYEAALAEAAQGGLTNAEQEALTLLRRRLGLPAD